MMWIMPLVFSIMFFVFPAGLVLYWLTNNILSIAQQYTDQQAARRAGDVRQGQAGQVAVAHVAASRPLPDNRPMPSTLPRHEDPIVAVATASGRGAVGIVPLSRDKLARRRSPRRCAARALASARGHATPAFVAATRRGTVDHGLVLLLPGATHSYTGEDVIELQAHGGPVVLQLLVARCASLAASPGPDGAPLLPRLRMAGPGEFTERAWLHDKLDLAQAEAVADLIEAGTEQAARSAARSLEGALSREADAIADALIELRVLVEATLDFPEEEVEFLERAAALPRLAALQDRLDALLASAKQGALLRDGIRIVLAGQPNVGKSSLFNALAGAELAIVTPVPGTTRDRIGETVSIEGVPVRVIDTAGLRDDTDDPVETIGIERSWAAVAEADAVVLVRDLTRQHDAAHAEGDARIAARIAASGGADRVLTVFNKADAVASPMSTADDNRETALRVSAATGAGLDDLRRALLARAGWEAHGEGVFTARARHVDALRRARGHLDDAVARCAAGDGALELVAEELRSAHDALGEITGRFTPDDLLGAIFSRFCIGK